MYFVQSHLNSSCLSVCRVRQALRVPRAKLDQSDPRDHPESQVRRVSEVSPALW